MTDYKPGTVAIATVRGYKDMRVMRTSGSSGADSCWSTVEFADGTRYHRLEHVTDIRPLVVLDPDRFGYSTPHILIAMRSRDPLKLKGLNITLPYIADQIEAQTKPPRIDEPSEPLSRVTAHTLLVEQRRTFVRGYVGAPGVRARWVDGVTAYGWDELIDPEAIA